MRLLVLALLACSSCLSFREVPLDRIGQDLDRGDTVRVTTHGDACVLFRVTEVRKDAVVGQDVRFELSDLRLVEVEGQHALRGLGELVEVAYGVMLVSAAVAMALAA